MCAKLWVKVKFISFNYFLQIDVGIVRLIASIFLTEYKQFSEGD